MSHFNITCPEDYQKYFHVSEQGYVWLDGKNNPILLTQNLTKRINSIPPHTLWSGRHTRSGVHSKDTPPHKGGPYNSTGNNQAPPSLDTPTSPIPTDQEICREIVQGVPDDPNIPRGWVGAALKGAKKSFQPALTKLIVYSLFSPNKFDSLQSCDQVSQPTSSSFDSHHLVAAQSAGSSDYYHLGAAQPTYSSNSHHQSKPLTTNSSHSHHKSTASDSNQNSNPQQIDLNIVMDLVKSFENKIRQESKQLEINRVKHESDLRNMSQQYESKINNFI